MSNKKTNKKDYDSGYFHLHTVPCIKILTSTLGRNIRINHQLNTKVVTKSPLPSYLIDPYFMRLLQFYCITLQLYD